MARGIVGERIPPRRALELVAKALRVDEPRATLWSHRGRGRAVAKLPSSWSGARILVIKTPAAYIFINLDVVSSVGGEEA